MEDMYYNKTTKQELKCPESIQTKDGETIIGFNNLTDTKKSKYGWYKITEHKPELQEYQYYDEFIYEIKVEGCVKTFNVKTRTNTEIIQIIKQKATQEIYEIYPEFKQRNALLGEYGQEYLEEMKTFIHNKRLEVDKLCESYETIEVL